MARGKVDIADEVAALGGLTREELADLWTRAYSVAPTISMRRELLLRSATWHQQAKRLGGLTSDTRRRLKEAVRQVEAALAVGKGAARLSENDGDSPRSVSSTSFADRGNDDRLSCGAMSSRQDAVTLPQADDASQPDCGSTSKPPKPRRRTVSPGARLMREWNGRMHVVDVVDDGFRFEGAVHRSLSVIARKITGAHWSGPRFFGL